jgi:hypothetical protein
MSNDLAALPWRAGQFHSVENYLEAVGVLCAIKAGLALDSVSRPILPAPVAEVALRRRVTARSRGPRALPESASRRNGTDVPDGR